MTVHVKSTRHTCAVLLKLRPWKTARGRKSRAFHDLVIQHLKALKLLGHDPSQAVINSLLEVKLDAITMIEWQRHSQDHTDVPDYQDLLDFLNSRAQATEASTGKKRVSRHFNTIVISMTPTDRCISCGTEKHYLYTCTKFRSLSHAEKIDLLRSKNYCMKCLCTGHFVRKCQSLNHCKRCQRPHHTLLHMEKEDVTPKAEVPAVINTTKESTTMHVSVSSNMLLMTCQLMVKTPQGVVKARALLDAGSSASFVTERLAQSLHLRRLTQNAWICGIAGCRKNLWCTRLVLPDYCESQNPPTDAFDWRSGLGWLCSKFYSWRMVQVETRITITHHLPKEANTVSIPLHGLSDAPERAYSGVVYIRLEDSNEMIYTSLVASKTCVTPKWVTIPRLELNGALILAQLLLHCKPALDLPLSSIHAWTDSTIVLPWIQGIISCQWTQNFIYSSIHKKSSKRLRSLKLGTAARKTPTSRNSAHC